MFFSKQGYIEVTGGRVWYGVAGADSPGTPLLTIHGGPGATHDYLEPLMELACERPVIYYDQLGGGNSDRPEDPSLWTIERFSLELAQLRSALHLEKLHILGQSWGTMLAVHYMLTKNNGGVKSLTLCSPYLSTPIWKEDQRRYIESLPPDISNSIINNEATGNFGSMEYLDAMNHFYRLHLCRMEPWPDCLNRTFSGMGFGVYNLMWGHSEFTITGSLKDKDLSGELAKLTVPVLYICGEFDEATPATTNIYHQMTPGSEIAVIAGASHMAHLERPREFFSALREFMKKSE